MEFHTQLKVFGRRLCLTYTPKEDDKEVSEEKGLPAEPHTSFGFGGFSAEVQSSEYYDDKQVVL